MVHPNAAAIDIGATMHMAAVGADRTSDPVQSFGTFTGDLLRLVDWFAECGVTTVVMESTSVYWIPIFELLDERGFEVFLVNARDAKHVPGRKTDVSDAQWLQRLHSYGLLRASFRPRGEIAELRAYLRQRERLLDTAASQIQHMQKAMTEMNLQLHHVVADITGATGMRIIRAIIAGERNPSVLASMRDKRCHSSVETIEKALTGHYRAEHLFVLEQAVALYDVYQQKVAACDIRIESVINALNSVRGRQEEVKADGSASPKPHRHRTANEPAFQLSPKGWVTVESTVGKGTTFRLYLPASDKQAAPVKASGLLGMSGGKERILLVEDEDTVRTVAAAILRRLGYEVFVANDGNQALALWDQSEGKFDLLLTDMVMPGGIGGMQLATRLRKTDPP